MCAAIQSWPPGGRSAALSTVAMAETSQGNRRLIQQAEKHHPKSHDVRPRSSLAPSGNASSSTSQDKTKTRPTSHTSPKKDLATRTHTPCLKRKCRAAKPGGHRRVGRRCHMLEGMYSRNNKRLLALLMFQSMRRDNLRGVFGVPRGDCEFLILRGASLSSSLGQSRRAQWWAPSPPPHARSSLERRHGGSRTHTKRRIPTGLLPGKRGALQVLLAWKLMCVCPPEDLGMGRASVLVQP